MIASVMFSEYNENCSLQEIKVLSARYLKYACIYDSIMWYRCPHSNHFYGIVQGVDSESEDCYWTSFDMVCPGDENFYQVCGHKGCAGYEV